MDKIDRFDVEILYCLYELDLTTPLQSTKLKNIIDKSERTASYYTYVNRIKKLSSFNYIGEGFKSGNAKCYYITKEGISYLENNVLSQENEEEE